MLSYSRLYDSMVAWYAQWYAQGKSLHFMTGLALALCMFFNILALCNVLTILGQERLLEFAAANNGRGVIALLAVLTVLHLGLAKWKYDGVTERREYPRNATSKNIALVYIAISLLLFFGSFGFLIAIR